MPYQMVGSNSSAGVIDAPPAEEEGKDRADRVDRDDAEPNAGDRHTEDRADRLQEDVEARALRGEDLPAGVEAVPADLTKQETLAAALKGVTTLVHAAAITANLKEPYPDAYRLINETGTANLMRAAEAAGVSRVIPYSNI